MKADLKKIAVKGFLWSAIERFGTLGIQFIITLILARLLTPSDFGLVGMLAIFIAIAQSFVNSGFGSALIQKKNPTVEDYSTVFYFNIVVSFLFYLILFITAPFIANFYNQPELITLTRVISLSFVFNAFGLIQITQLTKNINFKTQSKVGIAVAIFSGTIGITLAFLGYGVWALVFQTITQSFARSFMYWIINSWRPVFVFSIKSFKSLFSFGSRLLVAGLIDTIYKNIYLIVIGKFFNASSLGYYAQAQKIQEMPVVSITGIIQRVTFSLFAEVQDEKERLYNGYKRVLHLAVFISFPLMIGLSAVANNFIAVVLTDKWLPAVPYLQLLCFAGMLYPIHAINLNVVNVLGRSDLFLRLEIVKKVIITIAIFIGFIWGVLGLVIGSVITSFIALWINSYYTGKLINYGTIKQLSEMSIYFVASFIMGVIVYYIGWLFQSSLILLLCQVFAGVIVYAILARIFKLSAYCDIKKVVIKFIPNNLKFLF